MKGLIIAVLALAAALVPALAHVVAAPGEAKAGSIPPSPSAWATPAGPATRR